MYVTIRHTCPDLKAYGFKAKEYVMGLYEKKPLLLTTTF